MGQFHQFAKAVEKQFTLLSKEELYVVDMSDDDLFAIYLNAFPPGSNPIFKTNTVHDCNCCKNFVRNLGKVVALNPRRTVWDIPNLPEPYAIVAKTLANSIKQKPVRGVFRTKERQYGAAVTRSLDQETGKTHDWNHFVGEVKSPHHNPRPETARGAIDTTAHVLRRGVQELTTDAVQTVIDLIEDNAIYRGQEFLSQVKNFQKLQKSILDSGDTDAVWANVNKPVARLRNTAIGTLLQDLSAGIDLEKAVRSFEAKVAPTNYKRPTALITKRMLDDAVAKADELGLTEALNRRYATIHDVNVNNVLWVDNAKQAQMVPRNAIEELAQQLGQMQPTKKARANTSAIPIDRFLSEVVPKATSMQLQLENKHLAQFVSITTGDQPSPTFDPDHASKDGVPTPARSLFKWNNPFAWSYDGEVTDSITERVKRAGGRVTGGKLRTSLAWYNYDDLDIHAHYMQSTKVKPTSRRYPDKEHIFFGDKVGRLTSGHLDVDMNAHPRQSRQPVENIIWDHIPDGMYLIDVNQYQHRENIDIGFTLEVEYDGNITQFSYNKLVHNTIRALTITVSGGEVVKVDVNKDLTSSTMSQDKWGVSTNTFVPVDAVMLSPNHWDGSAVGNKHWFFILRDCKNPEQTRGFYNEFLNPSLEQHRKVFEVLGNKMKCPTSDEQLSGLGFSSTKPSEVNIRVKGDKLDQVYTVAI